MTDCTALCRYNHGKARRSTRRPDGPTDALLQR